MRIAFLGDIAFIGKYDLLENKNARNRLQAFAEKLSGYDYVIANLESPFLQRDKTLICKSVHLKSAPTNVELLKYLHINAVSLANNHTCDYGKTGLNTTIKVLEENQLEWFGANSKHLLKYIKDEYISFSGFCCYSANGTGYLTGKRKKGINLLTYNHIMRQLELDRNQGAFSCLSIHWGDEYTNYPNYEHRCLAENIAEKKDVVICGHHPHVIQGVQNINNSVIAYSLGNCLFDDCTSTTKRLTVKQNDENRKSFIMEIEIENGEIQSQKYQGIKEDDNGLVFFEIDEELQEISEPLKKINNRKEYEKIRNEQIQRTVREKFGRHDFMWYRNRMNYYSIGAYILAGFRRRKYQRVAKEFINQSNDFHKNKVLYVGNFSFPMGNAAGKRVYANGKLFRELGYEVIFVGMDKKIDASIPLKNTKSIYDGFTYYNFSYPRHNTDWLRYKREFKKLIKLLEEEELIQHLCLVIYYGEPRFSIFLTLLIRYLRRRNIKVVSDCVDWLTTKTGHYLFDLAKGLNDAYEMIYANIKTDGIITISSYLASYYEDQGCNTVIIPPLSLYEDVTVEPISSEGDIVITYAGEPFRKGLKAINRNTLKDRIDKTVILLYEAKKKGCHFLFHIYGFTKEEYLMALPSQKKYLDKLEPNIVFHGYKQNIEVMERVKNSDFTILIREVNRDTTAGFPTKISESISCGTPVITNRTSDLKYYIIEGKNGFFLDISEKRKASEKITQILSMDREEIYRMKKYCAQSQLFYYKNYIGQMEDFIHRL